MPVQGIGQTQIYFIVRLIRHWGKGCVYAPEASRGHTGVLLARELPCPTGGVGGRAQSCACSAPLQRPGRGHHSSCWTARLTVPQVVEHSAVGKMNFSHCFACSTRATLARDTAHSRAVSLGTKSQANFCCLKIKFGLSAVSQADG